MMTPKEALEWHGVQLMNTCETCACVIEPFRLRREACFTCSHRIPARIEVCDLTGEECRKRYHLRCEEYERGEFDLYSKCRYPHKGAFVGGGTVWTGWKACKYYVQMPSEQMELDL